MSNKLFALYHWIETKHGDLHASKLSPQEKREIADILRPEPQEAPQAEAEKSAEYLVAQAWEKVAAFSESMLGDGPMGIYKIARELEPTKTMLAKEKAFTVEVFSELIAAQRQAGREEMQEIIDDYRRLTRELDVALNGINAAKQASLCDIVAQVEKDNFVPASRYAAVVEALRTIGKQALPSEAEAEGIDHENIDFEYGYTEIIKIARKSLDEAREK